MPARRAMATTWMMALVEPPIAMCTVMAFSNAAGVRILAGVRSSHTMSTMRRPACAHMRGWAASAAGSDEAPGSVRPSASAIAIMVAAVPMVMQVPNERAMPLFDLGPGGFGDRAGPLLVPVLPHVRARAQHLPAPVAAQHRPGRAVDRRQPHGDGAHDQARRGLVAAAQQHGAVDGMRAQQLFRLHGEEIAVEHGGGLDERLGQRDRRQLQREAAGLQHAALDVLGARAQVRVAGIDVAPRIDDADDRLALPILARHSRSGAAATGGRTIAGPPRRTSGASVSLQGLSTWTYVYTRCCTVSDP